MGSVHLGPQLFPLMLSLAHALMWRLAFTIAVACLLRPIASLYKPGPVDSLEWHRGHVCRVHLVLSNVAT